MRALRKHGLLFDSTGQEAGNVVCVVMGFALKGRMMMKVSCTIANKAQQQGLYVVSPGYIPAWMIPAVGNVNLAQETICSTSRHVLLACRRLSVCRNFGPRIKTGPRLLTESPIFWTEPGPRQISDGTAKENHRCSAGWPSGTRTTCCCDAVMFAM